MVRSPIQDGGRQRVCGMIDGDFVPQDVRCSEAVLYSSRV
jgi:hypothetical protein